MVDHQLEGAISLCYMTRDLCHRLYKNFTNDPDIYMDMAVFTPFVYDEERVNALFDKKSVPGRVYLAVMLGAQPIGEISLKQIDLVKKECTFGIHLQSDAVKGRGYGTTAERLMLQYAFEELGMETILADAVRKNRRSQHILLKIGFVKTGEDEMSVYYRADRESVMNASGAFIR